MKFKEAYKKAQEVAKECKFKQTIELIFNLKGIDKKTFSINDTIKLPAGRGKKNIICTVGSSDFVMKAKKYSDKVMDKYEFENFKNKKDIKKFSEGITYFVVEASVMADFAKTFGQILGPKGKMPLPHHIVPPARDSKPFVEGLKNAIRIRSKKTAVIQIPLGTEEMKLEDLEKNFRIVYEFVEHKLERGKDQIKNVMIKFTMGPAVKING